MVRRGRGRRARARAGREEWARLWEKGGRYYIVGAGRVRCGSCGHTEFRALLVEGGALHLFCARCGSEHVDDLPPSLRAISTADEVELE